MLRWPQETDAEEIFARYANDPVVARYMLWSPHRVGQMTRGNGCVRARRTAKQGSSFNWLILLRENEQILGSIGCGVEQARRPVRLLPGARRLGPWLRDRGVTDHGAVVACGAGHLARAGLLRSGERRVGTCLGKGRT